MKPAEASTPKSTAFFGKFASSIKPCRPPTEPTS
jgi:hypothetical protein